MTTEAVVDASTVERISTVDLWYELPEYYDNNDWFDADGLMAVGH